MIVFVPSGPKPRPIRRRVQEDNRAAAIAILSIFDIRLSIPLRTPSLTYLEFYVSRAMRNLLSILASNVALESAVPILLIVSGLSGLLLAPLPELATLPATAQMLSGGATAPTLSRVMSSLGRRFGFFLSALAMALGGSIGVMALVGENFLVLVVSHIFLGIAIVGINYFRYAAAETVPDNHKASASSITLASGLVAVPIGGFLYSVSSDLIASVTYGGAYLIIAIIGVLAFIPIALLKLPLNTIVTTKRQRNCKIDVIWKTPDIPIALMSMGFGHAAMLLAMTPASIAAVDYGFGDTLVSQLITLHLVAMFAPGLVTGGLIRTFGFKVIIWVGAAVQAIGFFSGLLLDAKTSLYFPLILSGIGWNFMFLGGTHILNLVVAPAERSYIQGINETFLVLLSGVFVFSAAPIHELFGWNAVLVSAALLVLLYFAFSNIVENS